MLLDRASGKSALKEPLEPLIGDDLRNCCHDCRGKDLRLVMIEFANRIRHSLD